MCPLLGLLSCLSGLYQSSCVLCQSQPIDGDVVRQECLRHSLGPHRYFPDQRQCCGWIRPSDSYYDCKVHLSNNHQGLKNVYYSQDQEVQGMPQITQGDHSQRERERERERERVYLRFCFFGEVKCGRAYRFAESLLIGEFKYRNKS